MNKSPTMEEHASDEYVMETIDTIQKHTDRPIIFRSHSVVDYPHRD